MWHITCETWHITCDTWHVTCDMLWGVNILSKCQLPSSYSLGGKVIWQSEGKYQLFNELINYEAVCRTAPATPGLLNILCIISSIIKVKENITLQINAGPRRIFANYQACSFVYLCNFSSTSIRRQRRHYP